MRPSLEMYLSILVISLLLAGVFTYKNILLLDEMSFQIRYHQKPMQFETHR